MIINGDELEVVVERKKIKNIYFRINEQNQIYVTCPMRVKDSEIKKLLKDNVKSLERMHKKAKKRTESSEKILLLGNELDYVEYKKVMFQDKLAFGPSVDAVNEYLERHSLKVFQDRLNIYQHEFPNLPKFRLRIRKMKSRWGVCNKSSMTVTLNSLLIHKKIFLIDYVIVHELSHFEHMDHSTAFWAEVERHYPEYKKARKELRD
ncbi:MAG: DUF45 domain-containing protein [Erysipelotrichales bacterium]|nr:DUF45 domain-containing protein [Erysipelotrichales bacterium]